MSGYVKQWWSDDPADNTPLSAARLNHMEDGIANIQTELEVADGSITTAKLADSAVTAPKLLNNAVATAKIADLAVSTSKIAELAITTAKIAGFAVTADKIASGAVTQSKIASGAVDTTQLDNYAVTEIKIASNSVTSAKIGLNALQSQHYGTGSIDANHISFAPSASGMYYGDGAWNRVISLPFVPAFISIQAYGLYDTWQCWAGSSDARYQSVKIDGSSSTRSIRTSPLRTSTYQSEYIQLVSTSATYFRINGEGIDPDMNLSGRWYFWFAIGEM